MSSPLAIGAVSAVLRNLLDNGLVEAGAALGTTVKVSAVPPDTIDTENPIEPPRLNLFLYQVVPNAGWRNLGLPSRSAVTGERLTNAPLALDLLYLVTAYGRGDFQAEILLGYAMHLLHERPVMDRAAIRRALDPSPLDVSMLPPAFQALAASDLADQVEQIKLTPLVMDTEDMSKLWTALQSSYRPSAAYRVSVVLIEGTKPAATPLPVLSRGPRDPVTHKDRGVVVNPDLLPPLPTLFRATTALPQTGVRLGDVVTISGVRLAGAGHMVRLAHRLIDPPLELPPDSVTADGTEVTLTLPNDVAAQSALAAGQVALSVRFTPTGELVERQTNTIGLILAPALVVQADLPLGLAAATVVRVAIPPQVVVTMTTRPQVRLTQDASLMLDTVQAFALPRVSATDPLVFNFPGSVPAGQRWARLRVDGADSILLDQSGPAPQFDPTQRLLVPA